MKQREMKFRVWDILWGHYHYPDKGYQGHHIMYLNGKFENLQNGVGSSEVIIQQWTGLKDVDGKDIYEGDIISCFEYMGNGMPDFERPVCVVMWGNCFWAYSLDDGANPHQILMYAMSPKVIGNIFENPELK